MLRTGAARLLTRSVLNGSHTQGTGFAQNATKLQRAAQFRNLSLKTTPARALAPYRPTTVALMRHASSLKSPDVTLDSKLEMLMKPHPDLVSTGSSVRHTLSEVGAAKQEDDVDMMAGIRGDIKTIRETFSIQDVPKEALYVGVAGVVPYLATSLSTVFLAWDMNYAASHNASFLFDPKTAELLLHIIEPIQIGYGAVIISFLGAIHWGLEWANYHGDYGFARYRIGIMAPAIAWPTTLMPVEYALITQFLAFNWLYFTDANASISGMAPPWYGMYRFILTFIVGASIVATLVGRGQIPEYSSHSSTAASKVEELRLSRDKYLAQEEEIKEKALAEEGEDEEGGDDDE